jgi:hypothetical protein
MFHALVLGTLILLPGSSCNADRVQTFKHAATEHWTGWSIVLLRDLRTADQTAFVQRWGDEACPGIAVGHFIADSFESVAVLLQHGDGPARREMVVVGTATSPKDIAWRVASPAHPSVAASDIRTVGPGTFTDRVSGRVHTTSQDAIAYEPAGSEVQLLVKDGRGFNAISPSR